MRAPFAASGLARAIALSAGLHAAAGTLTLALVAGGAGGAQDEAESVVVVSLVSVDPPGRGDDDARGAEEAIPSSPPSSPQVEESTPRPPFLPPSAAARETPSPIQTGTVEETAFPAPPAFEETSLPATPGVFPGGGRESTLAGVDPPGRGDDGECGNDAFLPASAIELPRPAYPPAARRRGQEGTVLLAVSVGEEGGASGVEVLRSSGSPLLDRAACDAARLARFSPARAGERPIASTRQMAFTFRLEEEE